MSIACLGTCKIVAVVFSDNPGKIYVGHNIQGRKNKHNKGKGLAMRKQRSFSLEFKMQTGESLVEAGESRTPRPEEATQNILQA